MTTTPDTIPSESSVFDAPGVIWWKVKQGPGTFTPSEHYPNYKQRRQFAAQNRGKGGVGWRVKAQRRGQRKPSTPWMPPRAE